MKINNDNKKMEDIGILLFKDKEGNPLGNTLNINRLDMSITSLKEVDKYLERIRKNKKKLTDKEINKVILRTGTYLGEVIRRKNKKNFIWLSYEEGSKLGDFLEKLGKNILTSSVIYDSKNDRFLFVLGKPYKFMEYGKSESLWAFAKVCLEYNEKEYSGGRTTIK